MFVRDYMTRHPVTIEPDATFPQAITILRKQKIRRLPVVENGQLVGIVVEKDLLSNQPSPATTLSVHEIYSLLESLRIRQIMHSPVFTICSDCPVEEAARIMVEKRIGCLPVMENDQLVGIITETDIFKTMVEVLGGDEKGTRLTLHLPDRKGELAALTSKIAAAGGNILAVTSSGLFDGVREVTIKTSGIDSQALEKSLKESDVKIIDIRSSTHMHPMVYGE